MMKHQILAHGDIWAMVPDRFRMLLAAAPAEQEAATRQARLPKASGAVAILPVYGVITQRGGWFGGTSADELGGAFMAAVNDPHVKGVVFDIDSPGGSVYGIEELSNRIFGARGAKPVVAVANSMAASAADWIGSQADHFVVAPGGDVGSIGVFSVHEDLSKLEEQMGVRTTLIAADGSPFKVEGNPFEALSADGKEEMKRRVNSYFGTFIAHRARGSGVSETKAIKDFGQGRLVGAKAALEVGMVSRVGSLSKTLRDMGAGRSSSTSAKVRDEEITAMLCAAMRSVAEEEPEPDAAGDPDILRRRLKLYGAA